MHSPLLNHRATRLGFRLVRSTLCQNLLLVLLLSLVLPLRARADALLQLFNVGWAELIQKMPEIAEAGYTSLWLPPPTKASGGYSVGYDLWDPFDLGDKDQRGTVSTRYGTKVDLLRMVETAHRFGLRVYFDNIMNHRAFDVPRWDVNTPTNLYPGMAPGDFHLQTIAGGFYRNWDRIANFNDVWQLQNRPLFGLIDIAHETPNANFGATEGSTSSKPVFVRHPNNPEYYPDTRLPALPGGWHAFNGTNGVPVAEDVGSYLMRAVAYLLSETKCDGFRLDAVKHVPGYFFGDYGSSTASGYCGAIQTMFDCVHGYADPDNRNSSYNTEIPRDDALIFGEHLGEPPGFNDYLGRGMRLLDSPLQWTLNNVLGVPGGTLAGLEQRDAGGFPAANRVMFAQSHDNGFSNHRELQLAYFFFREGVPVIYSDGYNLSTAGANEDPFPRWAYAPYLGEYNDNRMPDLAYQHNPLARGGTRPRWGDADIVAFERYDYREGGSEADQTVVLFAMNDNYGYPGDVSFDDGVPQNDSGMPSTCYPVLNSRGQGLVVGFPPGSRLVQVADSSGKDRACPELLVRLATNIRDDAVNSQNDANPVNRKIYVGSQALAPGGGAIEFKIPSGGYVAYAYQGPEASRVSGGNVITFRQGGVEVPRLTVSRKDGRDGDSGFNPYYPFKMRGSVDASGNVVRGANASNLTYAIDVPIVTNAPFDIAVRCDGSAINALLKLDGGTDLNSHMGLGASNTFTSGVLDMRDNKPGSATDLFLGYEQTLYRFRNGPEKFAARDIARDTLLSSGAETYRYTVDSDVTTNVVNGSGVGHDYVEETCSWVYHDPSATSTIPLLNIWSSWRYDQSGSDLGTAWRASGFVDSGWASGSALLAVENRTLPASIQTILSLTNGAGIYTTNYYFRAHFTVPTNALLASLTASALVDDGAIFYVNGTEVYRYNMPAGPVNASTLATNAIEVTNYFTFPIPTNVLVAGDNVMAVEVHQGSTNSSDIVFGAMLQAGLRQRSATLASQPVEVWVKAGYQNQVNRCFIYYTTDGSNPEGAFGQGWGTTRTVQCGFLGDDNADDTIDWWKGTIPAQAASTLVKYKVALFKSGADTIADYANAKRYALSEFAVTNFNPLAARVWLHNNLNTNHTVTGLQEGFHIMRARTFLPRSGKSSVLNTFSQTFYYDAQPPDGVVAFPAENDTLRSQQYGIVLRGDDTVTEVEYNISDSNPANDDAATGLNNGNGLSNGVPVWVRATRVSPLGSLTQQYPNLPQEFRFNYIAIPSSGTATITFRLKEVTTSILTNRYRLLTRTVNTLAPPQTLDVTFPSTDGQTISLSQNSSYTMVFRFSEILTANSNLFLIKIDDAAQPRASYYFQDQTGGDGKNELRYAWTNMAPGPHVIEVFFNGDGLALQAARFVNVQISGVAVNVVAPPAADSQGRSPYEILLPTLSGVPLTSVFTITTETTTSVTNVLISFTPATNAFAGGASTLDTNFFGNTRRWDFSWTNLVPGTFTIRADALGGGSNTATRVAQVVYSPADDYRILVPAHQGDTFSFQLQTLAGQSYTVEYADQLSTNSNWQFFTNVAGNGLTRYVSDPAPGVPQRFYRYHSP